MLEVGFEAAKVVNQGMEILRRAAEIYQKFKDEGRREQLVVRGVPGAKNSDVSRRQEAIHVTFVNWPSTPDRIVDFTKKFGTLSEPSYVDREFEFEIREWTEQQQRLRNWWRFGLNSIPEPTKADIWVEQMIAGGEWSGESPRKPLLKQVSLEDAQLELRWARRGIAVEVVAPDLLTYIVLLFLREIPQMLRVCANEEAGAAYCTPYFVALRKDQKYCCKECSQAVATRRWWAKHGNEWRGRHKQTSRKRGKV